MASTTRSSITRLLRAAISHRSSTTALLSPHHILHSHHYTHTSHPLSFLCSHPANLRISNPHLFSTSRRARATKSRVPSFLGRVGSFCVMACVHICILYGLVVMWNKFLKSVDNDEMGTKFTGSLQDMFRQGHSVVVEGSIKLIKVNNKTRGLYYCYSATEVLNKPDQLAAALEKNNYIFAKKLNVANHKLNVAGEEPGTVVIVRCTTPSDKVSSDVMLPKSFDGLVLEGRDELHKGHSFFAEGSIKPIMKGIKNEYMPGKVVGAKVGGLEHLFSVEVFGKHDEKHMPQEAVAASVAGGGIEE